jgi:hypothetical protein
MTKEYTNEMEEIDDGVNPVPLYKVQDIFGFFETVSSVPTAEPMKFKDQIKFYVSGATKRIYYYDKTNKSWDYK